MNEPWCGDVYADPTLLVPGVADRRNLQPAYDVINAEIRKHDQDRIILFEVNINLIKQNTGIHLFSSKSLFLLLCYDVNLVNMCRQ